MREGEKNCDFGKRAKAWVFTIQILMEEGGAEEKGLYFDGGE